LNAETLQPVRPATLRPPAWLRWAQLVRLPTVFTVIAQVLAAFLVAAGSTAAALDAWPRMIAILVAAAMAYWAGMILNDVWDLEEDRRERPSRPLPSGQIAVATARNVAWGLLAGSIVLAALAGVLPAADAAVDAPATLVPAVIAAALAVCVVLYNGPLKSTPVAPIVMGVCRLLCFLLGASPLSSAGAAEFMQPQTWFAEHVVAIAVGFGIYITGITTVARRETQGDNHQDLNLGMLVAIFGAVAIALAPALAPAGTPWVFAPDLRFVVLIALITFPVVMRAYRASADPRPEVIQNLIRIGVLNVIAYSAALTLIVAGVAWAFVVFALSFLAILLSAKLRVT
jgi:4-hydroxybenzoate polyprenyltransferase